MTTVTPYQGCIKAALAAVDSAGGVFALANPEGRDVIVTGVYLNVTTVATGACTVDAGIAATATTSADTLIDGQDVHTATGALGEKGSNGKVCKLWKDGQYLTGSVASGASAGLVGYVYVTYIPV